MELELGGVSGADEGALTVTGQLCDYLLPAVMSRRGPALRRGDLSAAVMYRQDRLLQPLLFPFVHLSHLSANFGCEL